MGGSGPSTNPDSEQSAVADVGALLGASPLGQSAVADVSDGRGTTPHLSHSGLFGHPPFWAPFGTPFGTPCGARFGPILGALLGFVPGAHLEPKDKETQWFWRLGGARLGPLWAPFLGPILVPFWGPFLGVFLAPF